MVKKFQFFGVGNIDLFRVNEHLATDREPVMLKYSTKPILKEVEKEMFYDRYHSRAFLSTQ